MTLIEMKQVTRTYKKGDQEVHALRGVDLSIGKGEFLSIVGPSGSGKSTLLNIIGCLDTPTAGSMIYNGTALGTMNEKQLSMYRKDNIAFIFQSYNLIPVLSVRENVELPLVIDRKLSKKEMAARAIEVIEAVGLADKVNSLPKELSGGQEQRVAIARALVKKPIVVLADEPTANLDSETAENVIALMQDMNANRNTTFVFSTHDVRMEAHARRKVVLRDGSVYLDERK